jgi:hypothetical protein
MTGKRGSFGFRSSAAAGVNALMKRHDSSPLEELDVTSSSLTFARVTSDGCGVSLPGHAKRVLLSAVPVCACVREGVGGRARTRVCVETNNKTNRKERTLVSSSHTNRNETMLAASSHMNEKNMQNVGVVISHDNIE